MTDEHWVDQMKRIAEDFKSADVKSFRFTKIAGKITCVVTVLNASGEMVVWELVNEASSLDRWRKAQEAESALR